MVVSRLNILHENWKQIAISNLDHRTITMILSFIHIFDQNSEIFDQIYMRHIGPGGSHFFFCDFQEEDDPKPRSRRGLRDETVQDV